MSSEEWKRVHSNLAWDSADKTEGFAEPDDPVLDGPIVNRSRSGEAGTRIPLPLRELLIGCGLLDSVVSRERNRRAPRPT